MKFLNTVDKSWIAVLLIFLSISLFLLQGYYIIAVSLAFSHIYICTLG